MFATLMSARRFAPLFWCQFLAAFNDNLLKQGLVVLITFSLATAGKDWLVPLAGAVFIAPYFFLSALGGELADRHDKAAVARSVKLVEIAAAGIACAGFILQSIPVLFLALALFGVLGALFGPVKYGILPEQLSPAELSAGNALVEGATFLAILGGTLAAGMMVGDALGPWIISIALVAIAVACWAFACAIPRVGAADPNLAITRNPITSTQGLLAQLKADRRLWVGGHVTSWFWGAGAVVLSLLPSLIKDCFGGNGRVLSLAIAVFTVGIALGSLVAARASHGRPNMALVPAGALLMGLLSLAIASLAFGAPMPPAGTIGLRSFLASLGGLPLLGLLLALAFAGGLYIVPSFTAVQAWAPVSNRARVVAAVSVLNAAYMTVAAALVALLQAAGIGVGAVLALLGVLHVVAFALVLKAWGRDGVQDFGRFIFKLFLRLEVRGLENLPKEGERTVIAPNHVSLIDGPILHAILPGHAAFAVDTGIAQARWAKPFLKLIKALTIDPTKPLAARALVNVVKSGQTVVIFPEGRITVTGGLMKVYDGTAMIAEKADAWVVPVRIEGPERSPFGYLRKTQVRRTWLPRTTVTILPPRKITLDPGLKGRVRRQTAGARLQDIMVDTAVETARIDQTLFSALAESRRLRAAGGYALEDPIAGRLTYGRLILGAQVLGARLAGFAPEGAAVGVMLPNASAVAVAFFALQTIGRVPAMLNFTAGHVNVLAACRAAKIGVVLTSRAFVEKARLADMVARLSSAGIEVVNLEDIRAGIGWKEKLAGLLRGSRPQVMRRPGDPAVILFTSGSEGTPKGVVLSHRNILANTWQCLARIAASGEDKVFNVLPVFHSFGLTGGLMMPLIGGIPVFLYPSPLHYRIVPELVYASNATILFGTDTFLSGYARAAHPYDFHSVRLIMAGAEAVKERTRAIYMDKFGVRILEGYGVTETAPVLAMNTPLANRAGTVGRLSPLMEARLEPVPGIGEGGRLYVRGPNVMLGYLRAERPGILEPPVDGWHDTGDIVAIDADGYIRVLGRAKRFAKIAGEMVSLSAVEAAAAELWPRALSIVVSLPDPRKGERLVLMTTEREATREAFLRHARLKGMSELAVPAEILAAAQIPLLGSGKPDYGAALAKIKARAAQDDAAIESNAAE